MYLLYGLGWYWYFVMLVNHHLYQLMRESTAQATKAPTMENGIHLELAATMVLPHVPHPMLDLLPLRLSIE